MQRMNRKPLIIAGIVLVVFFALLILAVRNLASIHEPGASGNSIASENTPAATGSAFVGYDSLLNVGVTVGQIGALQTAFQHYKPLSASGTIIDMSKGTLTPYPADPRDPLQRPSIGTSVVVNQKTTYEIRFYYWGTENVQLLLFDSTGKTKLFDSGTITGSD